MRARREPGLRRQGEAALRGAGARWPPGGVRFSFYSFKSRPPRSQWSLSLSRAFVSTSAPTCVPQRTRQRAPRCRGWFLAPGRSCPAFSSPKSGGAEAESRAAGGAAAGPLGAGAALGAQAEGRAGPGRQPRQLASEEAWWRRLSATPERQPRSRQKDSTPFSPLSSPHRLAGPS